MKKVISLTSLGLKLISLIFAGVVLTLFTVLIVFRDQVPWYIFLFMPIALAFAVLECYACFFHKIKIDYNKNELKIYSLKLVILKINNVQKISVNVKNSIDRRRYCTIVFELKNNEQIAIAGYNLIRMKRATEITEEKIAILNKLIFD